MLVRALLVGLGSASAYNVMPSRMAGSAPTADAAAATESGRRAAARLECALRSPMPDGMASWHPQG